MIEEELNRAFIESLSFVKEKKEEETVCHICGKSVSSEYVCEICGNYYCEEHKATYNKFTQIDFNCCAKCEKERYKNN